MGAQAGRFNWISFGMLLRVRQTETFSAKTHLEISTRSPSTVGMQHEDVKMKRGRPGGDARSR
jgi:hypothetical protein